MLVLPNASVHHPQRPKCEKPLTLYINLSLSASTYTYIYIFYYTLYNMRDKEEGKRAHVGMNMTMRSIWPVPVAYITAPCSTCAIKHHTRLHEPPQTLPGALLDHGKQPLAPIMCSVLKTLLVCLCETVIGYMGYDTVNMRLYLNPD